MTWIVGLIGVILHIILIIQIYDIYHRYEPVKSVRTNPCPGLRGKRLVLIVIDGLGKSDIDKPRVCDFMKDSAAVQAPLGGVMIQNPYQGMVSSLAGYPGSAFGWTSTMNNTILSKSPKIFNLNYIPLPSLKRISRSDSVLRLKRLLDTGKTDVNDFEGLWMEKNIFFFHWQTPRETSYPSSAKSLWMNKTDSLIRRIESWFREFYKDSLTYFVVVSGTSTMSWRPTGSPGMMLAWGPNLNNFSRQIDRYDVPVFLASILGLSTPLNTLGALHPEMMNFTDGEAIGTEACAANQKACLTIQMSHSEFWKSFSFPGEEVMPSGDLKTVCYQNVAHNINISRKINRASVEIIHSLRWRMARFFLFLGNVSMFAWCFLLFSLSFSDDSKSSLFSLKDRSTVRKLQSVVNMISLCLFFLITTFIIVFVLTTDSPVRYGGYIFLTCALCYALFWKAQVLMIPIISRVSMSTVVGLAFLAGIAVEMSFWSYLSEVVLTVSCPLLFAIPFFRPSLRAISTKVLVTWCISIVILILVIFCRAWDAQPSQLIFHCSTIAYQIALGGITMMFLKGIDFILGIAGNALFLVGIIIVHLSNYITSAYTVYLLPIMVLSWIILFISPFVPSLGSRSYFSQIILNWIFCSTPLVMMSSRYEMFGIFAVMIELGCWCWMESKFLEFDWQESTTAKPKRDSLNANDIIGCVVFFIFIQSITLMVGGRSSSTLQNTEWLKAFLGNPTACTGAFLYLFKTGISIFLVMIAFVGLNDLSGAHEVKTFCFMLLLFSSLNFRSFLTFGFEDGQSLSVSVLGHIVLFQFVLGWHAARALLFCKPLKRIAPQEPASRLEPEGQPIEKPLQTLNN